MALSNPIATNKKPRSSLRKSGLIKLNYFVFVFIATTFFPRRLCAVTLAGLLALPISGRLPVPIYRDSDIWVSKLILRESKIGITVAGQLPTGPVRGADRILRNSLFMAAKPPHQHQIIRKNKFLTAIYNTEKRLSTRNLLSDVITLRILYQVTKLQQSWHHFLWCVRHRLLTEFLEIAKTGIPPDRRVCFLLF